MEFQEEVGVTEVISKLENKTVSTPKSLLQVYRDIL